jgi:L-threonate 2-dehydrogenase
VKSATGFVGLGIMGSACAASLIKRGHAVVGYDVSARRMRDFEAAGGISVETPRAVAERADVVITLLPGADVLLEVLTGAGGIAAADSPDLVVADCGTFDIPGKERCREALETSGKTLLDCTISGTGAQAKSGDLIVYASGSRAGFDRCVPAFSAFARAHHYVGEFGNGSKVKYIANLLVAVHNAAAAEALVLAQRAGLDLQTVIELVKGGAGGSRMLELRGPLMAQGRYDRDVASRLALWQKDMHVIGEFAKALNCPVPLFAQSAQLYNAAIGQGRGEEDMAAICAVLQQLAGIQRKPG